jgi:hypothetical protein
MNRRFQGNLKGGTGTSEAAGVSDVAYNAGTWDGVTDTAPSKNAVRDKFETLDTEKMAKASNLSDVANAATAFANIKQAATDAVNGVVELATDPETLTGTATDRALTPANLTAKLAASNSYTVGAGKTLDVSAGTLTLRDDQIPGAKVAAATETSEGTIELATNAEVLTGTDTTRAVSPAGLGYAIGRDIVYGVMWNTAASSPTLTKGLVIGGNWIAETFTSYPIQSMMKRCVLNSSAVKLYDLDAADSINKVNQAPTHNRHCGRNHSQQTR